MDTDKIVSFAKKDEAGARKCGSCGFSHLGPCTQQANVQTKYDQAAPFVQKLKSSKNIKEQEAAMGGLIDMLGHNARPPRPIGGRGSGPLVGKNGAAGGGGTGAGRGKGSPGAGKGAPQGTGGNPTTIKVIELSVELVQAIRKAGGCIGHAKGNCQFGNSCKFTHLSAKEVAALQKAAVAMAADDKKNTPTGKAQAQGKAAPVMTGAPDGAAALGALLTELLNEAAVHNGAAAISGQDGVRGFGLGWHLMGEESSVTGAEIQAAEKEPAAELGPDLMPYDDGEINEIGDNLEVARPAEIPEIRLVDRLRRSQSESMLYRQNLRRTFRLLMCRMTIRGWVQI